MRRVTTAWVLAVIGCGGEPSSSPPARAVEASPPAPAPGPTAASVPTTALDGPLIAPTHAEPLRPDMLGDVPAPGLTTPGRSAFSKSGPLADVELLATGPFAIDGPDLLVIDSSAGEVLRLPEGEWERARVLSRTGVFGFGRAEELFELAADDRDVFFSSNIRSFDGTESVFAIRRVDRDGGEAEVIVRGASPGGLVTDVFVDEAHVFYVQSQRPGDGDSTTALRRVAKTGGEPTTIVPELGGHFAIAVGPHDIVYGADEGLGGRLEVVDKQGGPPRVLARESEAIGTITLDGDRILYTVHDIARRRMLVRVTRRDGEPTSLGDYDGFVGPLVVDDGAVIWAEVGDHTMDLVALAEGAAPAVVVRGVPRGTSWTVLHGRALWGSSHGVEMAVLAAPTPN